jgi:short-subunit dehydrogenase
MVDINIKGVLYGIAAALPIFRKRGFGHFVNTASTAGHKTLPNQAVYSATKFAVRAISDGLRQEAGDKLRVTIISPGFVNTPFVEAVANVELRSKMTASRDTMAIPPDAIARAIAFAIEQPANVDVNEIVVRPPRKGKLQPFKSIQACACVVVSAEFTDGRIEMIPGHFPLHRFLEGKDRRDRDGSVVFNGALHSQR